VVSFSSLGFYPVSPGSEEYAIGSPSINNAILTLENGKVFTIEVRNQNDKNVYVQKATLNGKVLPSLFIKHSDITTGSKLVFIWVRNQKINLTLRNI